MQDIMEILVMHLVECVMPDPSQIPEPVVEQQCVLFVPLVFIRRRQPLLHVRTVVPVPLRILAQVLGLQIVQIVVLESIH